MKKKRLGEILRELNQVSADDLNKGIQDQQGKLVHLGELMLQRGIVSKVDLVSALIEVARIQYVDCTSVAIDACTLSILPAAMAGRCCEHPLAARAESARSSPTYAGEFPGAELSQPSPENTRLTLKRRSHENLCVPSQSIGSPSRPLEESEQIMMKTVIRITVCVVLSLASAIIASTMTIQKSPSTASHAANIERGKYLVEEVAKCTECHTPRGAHGQLDHERWLQGASIWITPVHATPQWAEQAPALAGFPGYSDEDGVNILEKGIGANGEPIRPPMHIYHMKHEMQSPSSRISVHFPVLPDER